MCQLDTARGFRRRKALHRYYASPRLTSYRTSLLCEKGNGTTVAWRVDIPHPLGCLLLLAHHSFIRPKRPVSTNNQPNQVSCGRLALTPRYTPHANGRAMPCHASRPIHFHSNVIKLETKNEGEKKQRFLLKAIVRFSHQHTPFLFSLWLKFILA